MTADGLHAAGVAFASGLSFVPTGQNLCRICRHAAVERPLIEGGRLGGRFSEFLVSRLPLRLPIILEAAFALHDDEHKVQLLKWLDEYGPSVLKVERA